MKIRKRTFAIILLAVVAYLGMVIGLALPLLSRYSMHEELQLIAVSSSRNKVGQPVHLTVEGAGFGKKTNFMLSLDSGNQQAIVYDSETSWPIDTILKIGSTLYLGDRDRKVHRFDISRPDRPEYQISYSLGDRPTALAEIDGSPWAASGYGEIGPLGERAARPVETIVDFTGDAEGVLYAAAARQGLVVFRQKNGTAVKIGALALPGSALSIAVAGNTAYVASVRGGLHICDISSPETPRLLSTLPLAGNNQALAVKDTRVFLSSADQFTVIDVQNRLQPRVLAQLPLTRANAIVIHNNLALLAASSAGLLAVDISDPARPFLAGHLTPGDVIRCLAVAGDRAYLGTGSAGLLAVDLNRLSLNPEWRPGPLHAPKSKVELTKALRRHATSLWGEVAAQAEIQLPPGCYAADAASIGPATYLATDCGLLILDRDQPGRLQVRQQPLAFAGEIAVDGSTAYVSGGRQSTELKPARRKSRPGLQVFDVSDPAQPRARGFVATSDLILKMIIRGKRAYLAVKEEGVAIVDLGDPDHPRLLGTARLPWPEQAFASYQDISLNGEVLYVANGRAGLHVFDVGDPLKPRRVSAINTPGGWVTHLDNDGRQLLTQSFSTNLQRYDISEAAFPQLTGTLDRFSTVRDIAIQEHTFQLELAQGTGIVRALPLAAEEIKLRGGTRADLRFAAPAFAGDYLLYAFDQRGRQQLPGVIRVEAAQK